MKNKFLFLILISFSLSGIKAQVEFDYSGYIVDMPIAQKFNSTIADDYEIKETGAVNLLRIRFRPSLYLWDGASLKAEYEINSLNYNSSIDLLGTGESSGLVRQAVDLNWQPVNNSDFIIRHFIDRLYFRQNSEKFEFILGRQRIQWGSGRVWNPTDLFNPINPAQFSKIEKDGADAAVFKYFIGYFTDIQFVYNFNELLKNSNYGFRFRTNYGEYDFSVNGGLFDHRYVAGLDIAGNLFEAGVRFEGIYSVNKNDKSDDYLKFIVGTDYQFNAVLYALIEYHYNGAGWSEKINYNFDELLNGNLLNLGKNYFATTISLQVNPLTTASLSHIINLNDNSGYLNLNGNYSLTANIYFGGGIQITYGSENSEYWYLPASLYLKGEYYF